MLVLNVPCSWLIFLCIDRVCVRGWEMIFRTVSAIAALMICVGALGGRALAQYYPPAQPYPPSQVYPPGGYYPRQGYSPLPPVVDDDADDDMLYDLPDRPLPPEPPANKPRPPATDRVGRRGGPGDLPPSAEAYEPAIPGPRPYYGVPGAIPAGPADSAKQDAIRGEAMRSRRPISPAQIGRGPDDPP